MANVLDIRRRIRSVKNTLQITKAMKMVSAAKLRRAQERALSARPYAQMLTNVLKSLVKRADVIDPETGTARHPVLEARPERNILLIVVTGDRGLAGAFNSNILKVATRFIASKKGKNIDIECIGRKGRDFFRRRYPVQDPVDERTASIRITGEHMSLLQKPDYAHLYPIVEDLADRYRNESIDSVYVLFNEFKSVIAQRLVVEQLMPVSEIGERTVEELEEFSKEERERAGQVAASAGVSLEGLDTREIDEHSRKIASEEVDYIYEQTPLELFQALLPRYVGIQLLRAVLESAAAEHAARMTAMDSASKNATDMIDSLTLSMNRARQAKITTEIIEIVSGAAAL